MIFCRNSNKIRQSLTKFCEYFELGAVRRCVNLVDLEKCFKMNIWLQTSAFIQKRASSLKFDPFRHPTPDFTASNLSTKDPTPIPRKSSARIVARPQSKAARPWPRTLLRPPQNCDLRSNRCWRRLRRHPRLRSLAR